MTLHSNGLIYKFHVFHGTDHQSAASICNKGLNLPCKIRKDHYLGQGVYFFREDWLQAKVWAIIKIKQTEWLKDRKPCIIMAYLRVPEEKFLNLDTRWGLEKLTQHIARIQEAAEKEGKIIQGTPKLIRCFIMDLLPKSRFYVIQRTFSVHSRYDNIDLLNKMELPLLSVQVCVRDLSVIKPQSVTIYKD
ncbi:MAG: hypothetical protein PHT79_07655 [Syntrophomonadaceae bacterium]|nr:hypothetical protein [Syntrophomonadaceae bacterium]MDD4549614.1 hypothetical protein [Syntrophomonadaceae bacterium]